MFQQIIPENEVVGVQSDGKNLKLTLSSGKELTVDSALVAVGAAPNTDLAKTSDLEVDPDLGGFLVNTELQARSDLYIVSKNGRKTVWDFNHVL